MKTKPVPNSSQGSALVVTLCYCTVLLVGVGSMLSIVSQQYLLSKRSVAYDQAVMTAEAGIDLGWNELNKVTTPPANSNGTFMAGWNGPVGNTWWTGARTLSPLGGNDVSSTYYVSVTTNSPVAGQMTIVATGIVESAIMQMPATRIIKVIARPVMASGNYALLAKQIIWLNSVNPYVDSYDSSDPTKSTNGQYDPAKRQKNGNVGSDSSAQPAIYGGGTIYGTADTGPGGTTDVTTDPPSTNQQDVEVNIQDVTVPWTPTMPYTSVTAPTTLSTAGGATTDYNLEKIDLKNPGDVLTFSGQGVIRVFVNDYVKTSGQSQVVITPNPAGADLRVEWYVTNSVDLSGQTTLNNTHKPANFQIYGLPSCTSCTWAGQNQLEAVFYAPQATVTLAGQADYCGSITANTIYLKGNGVVHYDETLSSGNTVTSYAIANWMEL